MTTQRVLNIREEFERMIAQGVIKPPPIKIPVKWGVPEIWVIRTLPCLADRVEQHRYMTKMCMARLRAEQLGLDTSQFPPRIRKRKGKRK